MTIELNECMVANFLDDEKRYKIKIQMLQEENRKLRECVELYNENYDYYQSELAGSWKDIREKARQTLKELEGEK